MATSPPAAESTDGKPEKVIGGPAPAPAAGDPQRSLELLHAIRSDAPATTDLPAGTNSDGGFSFGGVLQSMGWGEGEDGVQSSANDDSLRLQMATLTSEVRNMGKLLHALVGQQLRQHGPEAEPNVRPTGLLNA